MRHKHDTQEATDRYRVKRASTLVLSAVDIALITELYRRGADDMDIARVLDVSRNDFRAWLERQPEQTRKPMNDAQRVADARVISSLYACATGYDYTQRKVVNKTIECPVCGKLSPAEAITQEHLHQPPVVQAAMFWLCNRLPQSWRSVLQIDGTVRRGPDLAGLPPKALARIAQGEPPLMVLKEYGIGGSPDMEPPTAGKKG